MPDSKLELQQYLDELKKSRSGASSDTTKTTKPAPKKKLKKPVGGGITGLEPKETKKAPAKKQTKPAPKSSGLSSTEFKAWYHDPKSKEGRAAAKKLKEQVGAEKYKELNKKANDSYSPRGHISLFKHVSGDSTKSKELTDKTQVKTSGSSAKIIANETSKVKKLSKEVQKTNKSPLSSLQKHAINALYSRPGWNEENAEKYVRSLSDKDLRRLASRG